MTPSVISCTEKKKSNVKSTQGTATDNKTLSSYLPWMNFFQFLALTINNKKQRKLIHNIIFLQLGEVYLLMGLGEGGGTNWRKVIWNLYDSCQNFLAYYLIPSCVRITMTIRHVINFFFSSPYNYLLKTFNLCLLWSDSFTMYRKLCFANLIP